MASIPSKVPAVLSYLVATFAADSTLGTATSAVAVYDGPVTTEEAAALVLWVGLDDPDSDGGQLAAQSERQWAGLADQNETITISCVAEAWSGDDDIATQRVAAYGIVAAVETLVRADATGFGGNGVVANPGVTGSQLRQNNPKDGAQARVSFQIVLTVL